MDTQTVRWTSQVVRYTLYGFGITGGTGYALMTLDLGGAAYVMARCAQAGSALTLAQAALDKKFSPNERLTLAALSITSIGLFEIALSECPTYSCDGDYLNPIRGGAGFILACTAKGISGLMRRSSGENPSRF